MKDPAFLFYSQDFIVGVQTMTFEDRGKYITILAQMHQQGRLDEESIRFIVGNVSDKLRLKFTIDENGLWYNERLEIETEKRRHFIESRKENGRMGGRPKKPNDKPNAIPNGLASENLPENANEDENDNESLNNDKSGKVEKVYIDIDPNGIVKLQQSEYDKLIAKYGTTRTVDLIEDLSLGIGTKGYKYKSHYLAILNWEKRDKKKEINNKLTYGDNGNTKTAAQLRDEGYRRTADPTLVLGYVEQEDI